MAVSVSKSTDAVASSMMMIEEFLRSDRAMASSWRWPDEKLAPPDETSVSSRIAAFLAVAVGVTLAAVEDEASPPLSSAERAVDEAERLGAAVVVVEPVPSCTRWSASRTSSSVCS
jgi:hypothetical protein